MIPRLGSSAVLALVLAGCAGRVPRQFVLGRVPNLTATQLWDRTLSGLTEAHYVPEIQDPNRGVLVVPSRTYGSRSRFVIQLYREGWVHVAYEQYRGGFFRLRIPADLVREHLELTMALRRAIMPEVAPRRDHGASEPES